MKRSIFVLACAFALLLVGSAFATPAPNSAVLITRVFDDCPLSILATTNNYPALINITDDKGAIACGGWANLHVWRLSTDGATPAAFNNGDSFTASADLVINGMGEAGLQVSPWWSQNVDGRFNVRSTDGEIACFGGRLPFYSFTGGYGLHYAPGEVIHLEMVYEPNALSSADPATMEYKLVYQGMSYSSGALPFDEGNPTEDPPHGVWGMLNNARVGGYAQALWAFGTGVDASFTNLGFVRPPVSAVVIPRVFDDCPLSILNTSINYPSLTIADDKGAVACGGFANLHVWRISTDGVNPAVLNNGDAFSLSADLVLTGAAESGLQVTPWWTQNVDGRFNVRSTDGEIACFGGRLPFFSFTGTFGLHYVAGDLIHMEIIYVPHGLSQSNPATIQYNLGYGGVNYTSGALPFDEGNPAEDPPHGLWGILNDARVGGHIQVFMQQGNGAQATYTNIQYTVLPILVAVDVKPGSCENPMGANENGVLPVTILGSADLDVSMIDVGSLLLEGVPAKRGVISDVWFATTAACGDCNALPADGYMDLSLKFSASMILDAITPTEEEGAQLHLTGMLTNGLPIEGVDCVTFVGNIKADKLADMVPAKFTPQSAPSAPVQIIEYSLPAETRVTLSVYTVTGRLLRHLVQEFEGAGTHTVSWDVSDQASGVYFYRFEAGDFEQTVKTLIVR